MGTNTGAGLREIHVPTDPTKEPSNSVQEWTSVTSPPDIIKHIMTQNNKQFSQAKDTPLADTPLGRTIGHNGDSEVAEQILQGTFEVHHQISEVTWFIEKCKKTHKYKSSPRTSTQQCSRVHLVAYPKRNPHPTQADTLDTTKLP